jgi:hypothetical protein
VKHHQRAKRCDAKQQQVDRVIPCRDQPIHLLGGMMNGMKTPQPRHRVRQPVDAVDAEVPDCDCKQGLSPERAGRDPDPEMRRTDRRQPVKPRDHGQQHSVEQQPVHEPGENIRGRASTQNALRGLRSGEPLERNEDDGGQQQRLDVAGENRGKQGHDLQGLQAAESARPRGALLSRRKDDATCRAAAGMG